MLAISKILMALFIVTALSNGLAHAQGSAPVPSALSIAVNGGLSAASRGNGAAIGGRFAFDASDRLVFEAEGSHLGRSGSDVMTASASLLVNLLPGDRKTVPYLAVGGGLYRAAFDLDHEFGRLLSQFPGGTQMIPIAGMHGFGMMQGPYAGPPRWTGSWTGDTYSPDHMPAFYVDRLGQMTMPANGRWGMRSFTDPTLSLGGGVRLDVSPRLYVRPDARALVVIANGASYTVGVFSIGVGYRF